MNGLEIMFIFQWQCWQHGGFTRWGVCAKWEIMCPLYSPMVAVSLSGVVWLSLFYWNWWRQNIPLYIVWNLGQSHWPIPGDSTSPILNIFDIITGTPAPRIAVLTEDLTDFPLISSLQAKTANQPPLPPATPPPTLCSICTHTYRDYCVWKCEK